MSSLTPHTPISLAQSFFSRHINRERITRRISLALLLLTACILPLATIAALADGGTTTLVSVNSAGTAGGGIFPSVSSDGRCVAFESYANDLTANDTNGTNDIFVRDLQTGVTTLVSVNSAGTASGDNPSYSKPSISANGRYVAFYSAASDLTANDTNGDGDVFVRDMQTGVTTLVSVNSAGTASGNYYSEEPSISSDGRYVAFRSHADDLTANDTNGNADVFVRDLQTSTTMMVSVTSAGTGSANDYSISPSISANGRYVAFTSDASNLTANDTNTRGDVFVRDLQSGTTTLVSVNSAGTVSGNSESGEPSISADGRYVAFFSAASDLTANDTNGEGDVFVRDMQTGITTLVSVNSAGTAGGGFYPSVSSDGRYVAFGSLDLTANDTNNATDIFVRDLQTGTTSLVSVNNDEVVGNNHSFNPSINADGRTIAFISQATNLDTRDTNAIDDVYVRELSPASAQIQFDSATYTVAEDGTSATITVTRSGNLTASVTVNYATSDDTAFAGSDYDSAAGTLVFAANETTQTFTVPITDDSNTESSETLNLTLSAPSSGATLGTQSTAVLTIADDDTPATAPAVGFNPSNLNFGAQPLNTTSLPQTVTVTNTGDAPLHVSNVETTGADANDFAVASNTCTAAIAPNATCAIGVTFTPSATDARIAFLTLTDDAEGSPHSVLLEGGGSDPQAAFNATSVDFGNQVAGASEHFYRPTQDIIITNAGAGDLVITDITLSGADASEFSFTSDTLPITIPANSSTTVKARFAPTTPDFRYATLTFEDNAFDSPQTIELYGTGVIAADVAWGGFNGKGKIGDGTQTGRATPVGISGLSDVAEMSGGGEHSLAVKSDGTVWAWGDNQYGQLGDDSTVDSFTPIQVTNLSSATSVSGGLHHSVAVKSDGTVWAFGRNNVGQLGFSPSLANSSDVPVQVGGLSQVVKIAAGYFYNLALKSDGSVWAWGGVYGTTPIQVSSLTDVTAVATKAEHNLALKSDGTLWAWGKNDVGQLGDGTTTNQTTPVQVNGLTGVTAIAAGNAHSLAVKSDGTMWAWGGNYHGQLGDGTQVSDGTGTNSSTPIQVSGITNAVAVAATRADTLALTADGSVRQWGYLNGSILPVRTNGIAGAVAIAGGEYHILAVAASPVVTLDVFDLDFGEQNLNSASAEQTVTITNDGTVPLVIAEAALAGDHAGDFQISSNTCTGEKAAGATCIVKVKFIPTAAGARTASLSFYDNAFDSAQVIPLTGTGVASADLQLTMTDAPDPVNRGANLTYTLNVANAGASAATDVTLTDRLPTGLTFVSATPTQGTCAFAGGTVMCDIGSLVSGANASVALVVTPTRTGSITNTASVTALESDPDTSNNSASQTTTVNAVTDISVTMTDAPDPVAVGGNLTYTIIAKNNGADTATGVSLIDAIPAGTSFVSVRSTRGTCSGTTTVTCNIGTLTNNATATVTLVVRPNAAGSISNTATATANEYDSDTTNNAATQTTTVNAVADLAVTMTDAPDPVPLSSNVTYTIVVRNYGASPATGVILSDTLPAGLAFVSAASTQGTCAGTSTVTCAIGTLANNQTATVTLVATATAAATLTNTASVSGAENDPNIANNINRQSTRVTTLTSLTITPSTVTGACTPSTGKVTLSSPAPSGGTVVTLASLSATASVPASVIVPAGATSQTFAIITQSVAAAQTASIKATLGATSKTATLSLKPLTVAAITLTPNPVQGGTSVTGAVTLTCAATTATTVTLSSSNTTAARPTSASVVVPAGATTASFQVTTSATTVTRTAFINARAGGVTTSLKLTVTP